MLRLDIVGIVSMFGDSRGTLLADSAVDGMAARDLRLRVALETADTDIGQLLLNEVEALYCAGPAGGGGVRTHLTRRFKSASCLLPRCTANSDFHFCEASAR